VVTMWDVLEHVASPQAYLREIHRILRPGGCLVIKVPDPQSWEARLFGPCWVGYDAPRHLFGFPRPVLVSQLAAQGFEVDSIQCLAGGVFTFTASLGFWFESQGRNRLGRLFRNESRSTTFRVLTAPAFAFLRRLGLGSSLTYFAHKHRFEEQAQV
jgi:SAM-dependent methyltransferase